MSGKMTKCDDCKADIVGTYYEVDGKTVCGKDYEEKYRKKCSLCGDAIEGKFYIKDDKIICAKDYKKLHGDKMDCKKCDKKVEGEIIRSDGYVYHPACFKCSVCGVDLSTQKVPFNTDEKHKLYCLKDYNEKFAPKCCACKKPIAPEEGQASAQRLLVFDKDWHPKCFKCVDCGDVLNSGDKKCYPIDKTPLCLDCNKKRSK